MVAFELAVDGCAVEVARPAFAFVDLRPLLGGGDEGLGIKGHGLLQVHALAVGVLLVAAVHGYPGVGFALARFVGGAPARVVLDIGFYPDVFDAKGPVFAASGEDDVGHAALAEDLLGGICGGCASYPVLYFFNGDFYAAVDVARGNARASQKGYE